MSNVESLFCYILRCSDCGANTWTIYMDSPDSDETLPETVACAECGWMAYDFRDETPETENA